MFGSDATITWLGENDPQLLEDIVVHNETGSTICGRGNPA